jgi:isopentenyl-diphosphate delta-isomerase type 1
MKEYLDILDENGRPTGESATHEESHAKGLAHRSVHVWLLNSRHQLLLQKRSLAKRAYPGNWDISAAGHVSSGETSLEAARKEMREELGIDLPESAFAYLFTVEEHAVLNGGTYIENEFQDVYLVRADIDEADLVLQETEVEAVRWCDLEEISRWLEGGGEPLVPHTAEYERLLGMLGRGGAQDILGA